MRSPLPFRPAEPYPAPMKTAPPRPLTLEELWAYEDQHPVVFAAPRALAEARLIAKLDRSKRASGRRPSPRRAAPAR